MTNLHIYIKEEELINAYATFFEEQANASIKKNGQFNVVLSGGSSPKKVYELLASSAFRHKIDWTKVYFFFGDERYVPADDERNNGLMAEKALFNPLDIQSSHIFKIDTTLSPSECAESYMKRIRSHFTDSVIRFDLILLGLGGDGHTASLFPHTSVLQEIAPTVRSVFLKEDKAYRITLTAPLINQAKKVAFLVFGQNKAVAVRQILKSAKHSLEFPARLIQPENGELHWFLDKNAAGLL